MWSPTQHECHWAHGHVGFLCMEILNMEIWYIYVYFLIWNYSNNVEATTHLEKYKYITLNIYIYVYSCIYRWRLSWNDSPVLDLAYLAKKRISPCQDSNVESTMSEYISEPYFRCPFFYVTKMTLKTLFSKIMSRSERVDFSFMFHCRLFSQSYHMWPHEHINYLSPCDF